MFFLFCAAIWFAVFALALVLPSSRLRQLCAILIPIAGVIFLFGTSSWLQPWQRLLLGSAGLLYLLKASVLLRMPLTTLRAHSWLGLGLFATVWPGMDPRPLRRQRAIDAPIARYFIQGYVWACGGLGLGLATVLLQPRLPAELVGWLGLSALLMLIHFGYANILTAMLWISGWNVAPLFRSPLLASSLHDFWTRRWNVAFVDMNMYLFQRPLRHLLGKTGAVVGLFVLSGLLHEIGISYGPGRGWGLPLAYFAIQGVALFGETRVWRVEHRWPLVARRVWTWAVILLPLPLLFHAAFRTTFVVPLVEWLHQVVTARPLTSYFSIAIYLAALGHLVVLIASSQVPSRLKWKEDLAKLTPFNRKIMWTYGAFIVLCIVAFAALTWMFHDSFLRGEPVALGLAAFIATFWGLRIGVDTLYFKHADWPAGDLFTIGHVLLTSLFVALTTAYGSLLVWHLVIRG